ncbi:unnamed protein product [Arctogadus glacialis]
MLRLWLPQTPISTLRLAKTMGTALQGDRREGPTVSDSHSLLRAIASGSLRHPPPMRTVTLEGTSVKRATAESAAKGFILSPP